MSDTQRILFHRIGNNLALAVLRIQMKIVTCGNDSFVDVARQFSNTNEVPCAISVVPTLDCNNVLMEQTRTHTKTLKTP